MTTSATLNAWPSTLGSRLAQALQQSRTAHAPSTDGGTAAGLVTTRWRLPARVDAMSSAGAQALAAMLGASRTAEHDELAARCLQQYRQMADDAAQDDLGRALAAYLGACRQAFDHEPLTPQRWQAITRWLQAWVIDDTPWLDVPLAERQQAFERSAVLAVALGEWTVQASRQGTAQQASAAWMARSSLRTQLGLDLPALCAVLRSLDVRTAGNPSVVRTELGAAADRQQGPGPV